MVDKTKKDDVIVNDPTDGDGETPSEPTLFDAVSDAIDEETIGLDASADDDAPTGDEGDVTPAKEGDATPAKEGGDENKETPTDESGDGEPKADEPADGEGDGAAKDGDKEDLPGADKSGDADGADTDGADGETTDHVNDPIPEGLAEKTQERIRSLAERVKVAEAGVTERASDLDEMIGMVQDTGASGEQYGQMLTFMKLFNSNDVVEQRQAFQVMQSTLSELAIKLGEPVPGVDLLAEHADLQRELEAGTISAERANEVAVSRGREKAAAARTVSDSAQATSQAEIEAAIVTGKTELAAFEQTKITTDPQWAAKKAILVPALRSIMRQISPTQWKTTFEQAYNELNLPAVTAPVVPATPKTPTPLRPKTPAGEGAKQPSTMAEAIELSLGGDID